MTPATDPDVQAVLSRKYLAPSVALLPHKEGYALFSVHGTQRALLAIGTWAELEQFIPPESEPAPVRVPQESLSDSEIDDLLDGLDI